MKYLRRIVISLTVAFFAVCCGAVLLFNWQVTGWKALTVPTGSMRPTIPPGSLVLMHSVPLTSLKVGDVITYTNPLTMKSTVTHRIVKTYNLDGTIPSFITKGDANPLPDKPVIGGLVQGKAVWHAPYIGAWLSWSKTWVGLSVLVYVPALLLIIEEVLRLNEYFRASRPYKAMQIMAREAKARHKKHLAPAAAISLAIVAVPALIALPVSALLRSNVVSLANNNLTVAAQPAGHILIRVVTFECSADNSAAGNRLTEILFFNPTSADINVGNWYVQSSTGRVRTFPAKTVFDAQSDFNIEPDIPLGNPGWQYSGDFLALFNSQNQLVDGISWGSNTSQLNPPLPATNDGTTFRRVSTDIDTNTTTDWSVNFQACTEP